NSKIINHLMKKNIKKEVVINYIKASDIKKPSAITLKFVLNNLKDFNLEKEHIIIQKLTSNKNNLKILEKYYKYNFTKEYNEKLKIKNEKIKLEKMEKAKKDFEYWCLCISTNYY